MRLFCTLYGHWPVPFASHRRGATRVNRCWLCEHPIAHSDDGWRVVDEATGASPRS